MKTSQAHRGRLPAVATVAAALAVAASLASCGNHDDDVKSPIAETPSPPSPPVAAGDAFIAYVSQQVATADETSEPASVDAIAATAPEDTEPQPLPGA